MKPLPRRTLLRGLLGGVATAIALPPLEAMLGANGDALADGTALPTRFGVWFWGNGTRPEHWVPATAGAGWSPSATLTPLADLVPHVSVVTGAEIKTATHPHHSGMTGVMTGRRYQQLGTTRDTIVTTFAAPSVDQVAADTIGGATPFRSLELGITRFRGTDEGTTFQHLSHNGPNAPNPSEYDPGALYRRLFTTESDPRRDLVRRSVLDAVTGEVGRLKGQLGAADRARLDQHLTSIRTLEQRLGAAAGACAFIDAPGSYPDVGGREQIAEKNAIFSELLALALACDLTRVFTVQFSTCGSGVVFAQVGASDGMHSMCHFEAMPQPTVQASVVYTMEQLAAFLRVLRDTPEGDGSVLDHCSILCTSELSDGYTHSNAEYPLLVAGHGGGRLRGGVHLRAPGANVSHTVLTALRGAGVPAASFGEADGYVTSTHTELEA